LGVVGSELIVVGTSSSGLAISHHVADSGELVGADAGTGVLLPGISGDYPRVTSDGHIVAMSWGASSFGFVRLTSEAALDLTFGVDGFARAPLEGTLNLQIGHLSVNASGMVAERRVSTNPGSVAVMVRAGVDGELDESFGSSGLRRFDMPAGASIKGVLPLSGARTLVALSTSALPLGTVAMFVDGQLTTAAFAEELGTTPLWDPGGWDALFVAEAEDPERGYLIVQRNGLRAFRFYL
jgi:hypothetical protein